MKILKRLVLVVMILIAIIVIVGIVANESLPTGGKSGEEADKMALKMEKALGKEHWHDIQYVQWTFVGMHHFLWDKHRNMVRVKWGQNTVYITPGKSKGAAFIETERVSKELEGVLIKSAIDFFNNDMFWLIAPYKTFDDGVSREVVDYEGDKRLLVTYSSGGSTPGDSYLSNRLQYTDVNNSKSNMDKIKYGVPQGSILGPLLFLVYINDITNVPLSGDIILYADDTNIFFSGKHTTSD